MKKLVYKKRKGLTTRALVRIAGLFIAVAGLALAGYTFFPLVSYEIYIQPAFANQAFASPIPQATIISQDSITSLIQNTANQLSHLGSQNDNSWLPPTSADQYKEVGVTEQLSNYYISIPALGIENAYVSTLDNNVNPSSNPLPRNCLAPKCW